MGKFCWGGITLGSAGPASIMVDSLFGSGRMAMLLRGVMYRDYKGPFRRLGQSVWGSYRPLSSEDLYRSPIKHDDYAIPAYLLILL